jgi:hypothetical protein
VNTTLVSTHLFSARAIQGKEHNWTLRRLKLRKTTREGKEKCGLFCGACGWCCFDLHTNDDWILFLEWSARYNERRHNESVVSTGLRVVWRGVCSCDWRLWRILEASDILISTLMSIFRRIICLRLTEAWRWGFRLQITVLRLHHIVLLCTSIPYRNFYFCSCWVKQSRRGLR